MSADEFDPHWRPGPVEITDPWTGRTFTVYPSAPPESYPKGFFGDVYAARFEHFSPAEKAAYYRFQLSLAQYNLARAGSDAERDPILKRIAALRQSLSEVSPCP